jgi:hypothetical protein
MSEKNNNTEQTYQLPSSQVLTNACKFAIVEDKPIMLDYWVDSNNSNTSIIIGVRENGEKLLVKSEDEYTSPVSKIYKVENSYICVTENSIYLVSSNIKSKRIS